VGTLSTLGVEAGAGDREPSGHAAAAQEGAHQTAHARPRAGSQELGQPEGPGAG
jgi:hypothetical protein